MAISGSLHDFVLNAIESLHGIDNVSLPRISHAIGGSHIEDRIARAAKLDALKAAGQKAGMPLTGGDRLLLPVVAGGDHHDEAGQVVGLGTESVEQP